MRKSIQRASFLCLVIYGLGLLHGWVPHTHHHHHKNTVSHSTSGHHDRHGHDQHEHDEKAKDKKDRSSWVQDLFHAHSHTSELAFEKDNFHEPGHALGQIHPLAIGVFESSNHLVPDLGRNVLVQVLWLTKVRRPDDPFPDKNGLRAPPSIG